MRRPRFSFDIDEAALELFAGGSETAGARREVAEELLRAVPGNAPRGTGAFSRSLFVEQEDNGPRTDIYASSSDFAAHIIEFGSINNPAYAPFRKAADQLGVGWELNPR